MKALIDLHTHALSSGHAYSTVKENIESGAYLSKKPISVDELLKTLGLEEHQNKYPNHCKDKHTLKNKHQIFHYLIFH